MATSYPYKLGLLGAGAMGSALLRGNLKQETLTAAQVVIYEPDDQRCSVTCRELGVHAAASERELVTQAETVLLAIKPQVAPDALPPLAGVWHADQLVVSIMAGVPLARLREWIGQGPALVRVMPNVMATVGEGAAAYAAGPEVAPAQVAFVDALLGSVGLARRVDEKLLDAVTGLSGSGPAFAAVFCEALADGGVAAGLPRALAQELAAQVLVGVGRWVLANGSPAALKDQVTSPAGTTIAGLQALEAGGLRAAASAAVRAAAERSAELGKK
jgi:pyrroline-5-carboxylate reductase